MKLMKGIVVTEKNVVKVADDIPVPELGPYDCLCRVRACGFCTGTDFGIIHGLTTAAQGFRGYPTVLGHEGAGEVVEVGEKVRHIKVGDRFIHPNLRPDVGNGYTKTYGGMAQFGLVCDQQAMVEDGVCKPEEVPFYKKQGRFSDKIDFVDAALLLSLCECHSSGQKLRCEAGGQRAVLRRRPHGHGAGAVHEAARRGEGHRHRRRGRAGWRTPSAWPARIVPSTLMLSPWRRPSAASGSIWWWTPWAAAPWCWRAAAT